MLLAEHIKGCPEAGVEYSIFSVSSKEKLMVRLLNKHLRPYISHAREVWEWRKLISPDSALAANPFLQRQSEPALAVSSRHPMHLLAGANGHRAVDLPGGDGGARSGVHDLVRVVLAP